MNIHIFLCAFNVITRILYDGTHGKCDPFMLRLVTVVVSNPSICNQIQFNKIENDQIQWMLLDNIPRTFALISTQNPSSSHSKSSTCCIYIAHLAPLSLIAFCKEPMVTFSNMLVRCTSIYHIYDIGR
jgi:hypothetical protein